MPDSGATLVMRLLASFSSVISVHLAKADTLVMSFSERSSAVSFVRPSSASIAVMALRDRSAVFRPL